MSRQFGTIITDARKEVAASRAPDCISIKCDVFPTGLRTARSRGCDGPLIHILFDARQKGASDSADTHELRRRGFRQFSRLAHGGGGLHNLPRRRPQPDNLTHFESPSLRIQSYAREISSCRKIVSGFRK